jgi:NADH-ubiquinone oxidoreductase chain 4
MLIRLSKLPIFRLHSWLPKVHVEASMHGSMILAGLILKIGIVFIGMFGVSLILSVTGIVLATVLIFRSDGKVVMAYSSVAHMTICAFLLR